MKNTEFKMDLQLFAEGAEGASDGAGVPAGG
jgi:hypothetical protein